MAKNLHAEGASKAINKTITEIEDVLAGLVLSPAGSGLRNDLRLTIAKLAQHWFRRGFRRGCIEAHRSKTASGKPPKPVIYDARRDFFDGRKRPVNVRWKPKP
jgi:hypothetical protein